MSPINEEVKRRNFIQPGITIKEWAQAHGFRPYQVYRVLGGKLKTNYGKGHEIAVQLGMKPGIAAGETQS